MALLATLKPDERGIVDIYAVGTYAGGIIPHDRFGDLAIRELWGDGAMPGRRDAYEILLIKITGGFAD